MILAETKWLLSVPTKSTPVASPTDSLTVAGKLAGVNLCSVSDGVTVYVPATNPEIVYVPLARVVVDGRQW